MNGSLPLQACLLSSALLLAACQPDNGNPGNTDAQAGAPVASMETAAGGMVHDLEPLPGVEAPELTDKETVRMRTSAGDLVIEVYPQAAPNAAARFVELVRAGFYDDTPI